MKLRWRKRPSATVLHLSVLITLGSALPLAISSSRPSLSIGARHPVMAGLAQVGHRSFDSDLIHGSSSPFPGPEEGQCRYRPFCMKHESCQFAAPQKVQRNQWSY